MNAMESKFVVSQSKAGSIERKRAFVLPSSTLICLDVSSPMHRLADVAAVAPTADVVRFDGTSCSMPFRHLNELRRTADLVMCVTASRSWADFASTPTTRGKRLATMAEEWTLFRARNRRARLVLIDLQAQGMTRAPGHPEVLQVGGFSDAMLRVVALFAAGKLDV
jgi:60 kDa SS-A/Ro ribonucleoprotein